MTRDGEPGQVRSTRPMPGSHGQPIALATVLGWNVLALTGWIGYVIVTTRRDPDWGNLVALVEITLGLGAAMVSLLVGGLVAALISRKDPWRKGAAPVTRAVWYGTVGTVAGIAPFLLYATISLWTA